MRESSRWLFCLPLLVCLTLNHAFAGGSGLNVAVVINQSSTNSIQLGNYYAERRQVPPQNILRTSWVGSNIEWTKTDFETVILNPLLAMLSARQLTNQIDYVVLSMDFPFRVTDTSGANSTTATLFYGFKADGTGSPQLPPSCFLPSASSNAFAASESIFRATPPTSPSSNSFLVAMITDATLDQAKAVVDNGVAGDFSFPTQTVILGKSTDPFRNVRYWTFDNPVFNTRLRGNYSIIRTNTDNPTGLTNLLGYENGHYQFTISPNTFIPGAMADSLTSYGGIIFGPNDHTTLLTLLNAGASGSYGTVIEPCNYLEKFPSPQTFFYQSRGFSLAECYYQAVTNPYQGLLVGEPLSAPFAQPASAAWSGLPANSLLAGTTNLSFQANGDARHPIQQVDLFLDGTYLQTVTNIAPRVNNMLYVVINGFLTNYTVPAGATIKSVVSNLTARLNATSYSNATKVAAFAHGDRIELQSLDLARTAAQTTVSITNSIGIASALTTCLFSSRTNFLDSTAYGIRSYAFDNTPAAGAFLQLIVIKTNGQTVVTSVTNTSGTMTSSQIGHALFDSVNTNAALQGADGVVVEDIVMHEDFQFAYGPNDHEGDFNVRARSFGWTAAQAQIRFTGSASFAFAPSSTSTNHLDESLEDLRPRNHLYLSAGSTNVPLIIPLNTTTQADGFHELSAVVYEGTHVRTETRIAQNIRIQNGTLNASLTTLPALSNATLAATIQFSVMANTNTISKIELFSTGGSLGSVSNLATAGFSIAATNLGLGLHPFYAIVTATNGKQFRTQTLMIRIVASDVPFPVGVTAPPPTLTWPATPGRSYDILSTTNLANSFQLRATVVATNSLGQWTETDTSATQRFYRVRTTN
jgi:uncharacterized protein (TIGR03790 family)